MTTHNRRTIDRALITVDILKAELARAEDILARMQEIDSLPDWRERLAEWNEMEVQLDRLRRDPIFPLATP